MRFNVLGPLEVVGTAGPVSINGTRRRALLTVLLLRAGRTVPLARLVDGIWPDDPPVSAIYNVRTYVHGLRRLLADAGDSPDRLARDATGYRLHVEPDELDLLRFERLVEAGRAAMRHNEPRTAATELSAALALWRGTPLEDVPSLGADLTATALHERHWEAVATLVDARLRLGEHYDLLPELRNLVAERPLDERTHAQLINALGQAGRTADALEAYQDARRLVLDELGVEPGPALQAAQLAILSREPDDAALITADTGTPEPAGHHTPAPAYPSRGLPMKPPTFVGRGALLRQLRTIAAGVAEGPQDTGHATVVLVTGAAGIGKSTLAVAAGYEMANLFPDGQLFACLDGSTNAPRRPADLLGELLVELGTDPSTVPDGFRERAALFRCLIAGRQLLVVLDDAAGGGQLAPLLPGAGRCLVLVTSRSRLLDLEVGWRLNLGPLARHDAVALLASAAGAHRVEAAPEASHRIAAACEELPLAIRIVGARLAGHPGMTLLRLADRLEDEDHRLEELTVGDISVRQSLLESYEALDPAARAALRALGSTDRPITGAAAPLMLGIPSPEADSVVERLVQYNLLTPVGPVAADEASVPADQIHGGGQRYAMSELLRLVTREQDAP